MSQRYATFTGDTCDRLIVPLGTQRGASEALWQLALPLCLTSRSTPLIEDDIAATCCAITPSLSSSASELRSSKMLETIDEKSKDIFLADVYVTWQPSEPFVVRTTPSVAYNGTPLMCSGNSSADRLSSVDERLMMRIPVLVRR
jgi:hypothetical protein